MCCSILLQQLSGNQFAATMAEDVHPPAANPQPKYRFDELEAARANDEPKEVVKLHSELQVNFD